MSLTADRLATIEKYDPNANRLTFPATDSTQYFKGGLVALVAGKLVKPTTATVGASGVYVCEDNVLTGVATTVRVRVRTGVFKLANGDSIASPADLGKLAFIGASGDDTVYKAGAVATDVVVGLIEDVDGATGVGGAGVWVKIMGNHEYLQSAVAVSGS